MYLFRSTVKIKFVPKSREKIGSQTRQFNIREKSMSAKTLFQLDKKREKKCEKSGENVMVLCENEERAGRKGKTLF